MTAHDEAVLCKMNWVQIQAVPEALSVCLSAAFSVSQSVSQSASQSGYQAASQCRLAGSTSNFLAILTADN